MPAPVGRDLELTRSQLEAWLPEQLPSRFGDVADVRVGELSAPEATGFSSDTLMFDVSFVGPEGQPETVGLVARIRPTRMFLSRSTDLASGSAGSS